MRKMYMLLIPCHIIHLRKFEPLFIYVFYFGVVVLGSVHCFKFISADKENAHKPAQCVYTTMATYTFLNMQI